jgi:hypothetical protein
MSGFVILDTDDRDKMVAKARDEVIVSIGGHSVSAIGSQGQTIRNLPSWKLKRGIDNALHHQGSACIRERLRIKMMMRNEAKKLTGPAAEE